VALSRSCFTVMAAGFIVCPGVIGVHMTPLEEQLHAAVVKEQSPAVAVPASPAPPAPLAVPAKVPASASPSSPLAVPEKRLASEPFVREEEDKPAASPAKGTLDAVADAPPAASPVAALPAASPVAALPMAAGAQIDAAETTDPTIMKQAKTGHVQPPDLDEVQKQKDLKQVAAGEMPMSLTLPKSSMDIKLSRAAFGIREAIENAAAWASVGDDETVCVSVENIGAGNIAISRLLDVFKPEGCAESFSEPVLGNGKEGLTYGLPDGGGTVYLGAWVLGKPVVALPASLPALSAAAPSSAAAVAAAPKSAAVVPAAPSTAVAAGIKVAAE